MQTSSLAACPRALPGPEQRQEMWSKEAARGQTLPHHRVPVHFCLCHLPSCLQGSQDGLITVLNSFQLSLITLQMSKSSPAGLTGSETGRATQGWGSRHTCSRCAEAAAGHQCPVQTRGTPSRHAPYLSPPVCPCVAPAHPGTCLRQHQQDWKA